ncbi:sigma-70 family RNA polymerase sigma factor [Nocardia sp. NPDC051030]|uniref:sigma-70 family RNA polymerase sigma factor n=1 Tax=Nocardia sp. NPDC051030 TaxID=3155162 RepID=UPI003430A40E
MTDVQEKAEAFESQRRRLRAVAYRMVGSMAEAEDAVQEAWLRFDRAELAGIDNLEGWLTTVVTRICLDALRTRQRRREDPLGVHVPEGISQQETGLGPEDEAVLGESVERAMLVVLNRLRPAERVAFVLHDMFRMPFDEIAAILRRTPNAARLLATRARHRIADDSPATDPELVRHRDIVTAFYAASRAGDFEALLNILDPEVVAYADAVASPTGAAVRIQGAERIARQAIGFGRVNDYLHPIVVNGRAGALVATDRESYSLMMFTVTGSTISRIDIVGEKWD